MTLRLFIELYFIAGMFFAGSTWTLAQQEGCGTWDTLVQTIATIFIYPWMIVKSIKVSL